MSLAGVAFVLQLPVALDSTIASTSWTYPAAVAAGDASVPTRAALAADLAAGRPSALTAFLGPPLTLDPAGLDADLAGSPLLPLLLRKFALLFVRKLVLFSCELLPLRTLLFLLLRERALHFRTLVLPRFRLCLPGSRRGSLHTLVDDN